MREIGHFDPSGTNLIHIWCERFRFYTGSVHLSQKDRWSLLHILLLGEANQHARMCCGLGVTLPNTLRSLNSSFASVYLDDIDLRNLQRRASRHFLLASFHTSERFVRPQKRYRQYCHGRKIFRLRQHRMRLIDAVYINFACRPSNLHRVAYPDVKFSVVRVFLLRPW